MTEVAEANGAPPAVTQDPAPAKKKKEKKPKPVEISLEPPSGTRDFYPPEQRIQSWLFDKWRMTAEAFGFEEYSAPILENEILYVVKAKGDEEILQQMYNFTDKEGAKVTLRPEMTPSLARMILNLQRSETGEMSSLLPLKWWSIPQCWRFETTQRGRKREHYQWNMDMIGTESVTAEAELLASICYFFESVGLVASDVCIRINSRKVLGAVLENAGITGDAFAEACIIIDKQDKIGSDETKKQLQAVLGVSQEVADSVVDATAATTVDEFGKIAKIAEDSPELMELKKLFKLLEGYGYGDWVAFDASIVRGLSYYTGVVFEAKDRAGELRAICGGGRYDQLMKTYGSKKSLPMCGYGFGDCVIFELLKDKNLIPPELATPSIDFVVAAFNEDMQPHALMVANKLRQTGAKVALFQEVAKKIGKAFNYADRLGAQRMALIAPGEWEQGLVRIKDLRNQELKDAEKNQIDVPVDKLDEINSRFQEILDSLKQ